LARPVDIAIFALGYFILPHPVHCWNLDHSLTAVLDQLRVVASSTSNDPGPRSRQHQQIGQRLLPIWTKCLNSSYNICWGWYALTLSVMPVWLLTLSVVEFKFDGFSIDMARSMVAMRDVSLVSLSTVSTIYMSCLLKSFSLSFSELSLVGLALDPVD